MHLCIRGIDFASFYDFDTFLYLIFESFRQCDCFCFSFDLIDDVKSLFVTILEIIEFVLNFSCQKHLLIPQTSDHDF